MTRHPFLSPSWMQATNEILGRTERPVVPPIADPRVRVTTDDTSFDLVLTGRTPGFEAPTGTPAATVTIERPLLEAAFLDGEFPVLFSGAQDPSGSREALLYFLYHLYPDGPRGAAETAAEVRAHTAE